MKITLIIATLNSEKTIKSCIDSIFNQIQYVDEIIVQDCKSNDHTLSILEAYKLKYPQIKIFSETDNGIYDALNKGIRKSTGELIGFVHSDDFLADSMVVSDVLNKLISENLDGVYGDLHYVSKSDDNKVIRHWISSSFDKRLLKSGWMPPHPTFFLKKSVYEKHGLFNLNYSISADYDFILRILSDKSLKFGYLPKVITKMRVGGESNRSLKNIIIKIKEDYMIIKKNNVGSFLTLLRKNTSKFKQFI